MVRWTVSRVWLVLVLFGISGCAVWSWMTGRSGDPVDIRDMHFRMGEREEGGELDVVITYQDPSAVDDLLRYSRVLTFSFSIKNRSDRTISFDRQDIKLNVGIPQDLEPIDVDAVVDEVMRTRRVPTYFVKVLKIISSQSSAFHPTSWKRLAEELTKRSLRDGDIQPGETKKGLVFFMRPERPLGIHWANLEFSRYPPQAIETKGWGIDPGGLKNTIGKYLWGDKPPFERSYALLIGIGEYTYFKPLNSPPKDVEKVRRLFENDFEIITCKMDREINVQDLKNPQNYFTRKIQEEDRFLFYYSGHGQRKEGTRGYLPLPDEKPGEYDHSIPMDDLVRWMNALEAKHLLVVLDCCYSGWAAKPSEVKAPDVDFSSEVLKRLCTMPARFLLMAGTRDQETIANDDLWGGSLFTDALVRGLRKEADVNNDRIITIRELHQYLELKVFEESGNVKKPMNPVLMGLGEYGAGSGLFFFIRK